MTPQITAAITGALATVVSVLSVWLGVLIGHRLAEQSRLRDRLRIAYADFVSAIHALLREKMMLEADRAQLIEPSDQKLRDFSMVRFDASNRRVVGSSGNVVTAWIILDLVEVDREFRERITDIFGEIPSIAKVDTKKQLDEIATLVENKCASLIGAIKTKHPLLKLGRTA